MQNHGDDKADRKLVEFDDEGPVVDAELIGDLLDIPPDQVPVQIRQGTVTTQCEAGEGEHDGWYRLSFFHGNRRAQIEIDSQGLISNRTVIDFGDRPLPASLRGGHPVQAPENKDNE